MYTQIYSSCPLWFKIYILFKPQRTQREKRVKIYFLQKIIINSKFFKQHVFELSLDTTDEAVDWVCTLIAQTNYINDICVNKYSDDLSGKLIQKNDLKQSWTSTIYIYLSNDTYVNTRIQEINDLLSSLQRTGLASELKMLVVEEKFKHKEACSPVNRIGKRFVILADDVSYNSETADEITVRLKTSLTFGSGLHPATILALQLLERYVMPSMQVLDLGSGSGILSVAGAKLGATVLALDNDPIAVQSTQDAVHRNSVEAQVKVMAGSLGYGSELGHWMGGNTIADVPRITSAKSFDLIVANIFARIHITLIPEYQQALRSSDANPGILIAAGFTSDYEETITTALEDGGFEVFDCNRLNEWVAIASRLDR
jgi:ribosomal protein L11 methyltransferase